MDGDIASVNKSVAPGSFDQPTTRDSTTANQTSDDRLSKLFKNVIKQLPTELIANHQSLAEKGTSGVSRVVVNLGPEVASHAESEIGRVAVLVNQVGEVILLGKQLGEGTQKTVETMFYQETIQAHAHTKNVHTSRLTSAVDKLETEVVSLMGGNVDSSVFSHSPTSSDTTDVEPSSLGRKLENSLFQAMQEGNPSFSTTVEGYRQALLDQITINHTTQEGQAPDAAFLDQAEAAVDRLLNAVCNLLDEAYLARQEIEIYRDLEGAPNVIRGGSFVDEGNASPRDLLEHGTYMEIGQTDLQEFVEGGAITELSFGDRLSIMRAMTNGVQGMVYKGYYHNDIKPDNFVLVGQKKPKVKVIDFGKTTTTARYDYAASELSNAKKYLEESEGIAADKLEIEANKLLVESAHVRKLGLSFLPLLLGRRISSDDVQKVRITEKPASPQGQLRQLIAKCLSHDPLQRPNLTQLRQQLDTLFTPHAESATDFVEETDPDMIAYFETREENRLQRLKDPTGELKQFRTSLRQIPTRQLLLLRQAWMTEGAGSARLEVIDEFLAARSNKPHDDRDTGNRESADITSPPQPDTTISGGQNASAIYRALDSEGEVFLGEFNSLPLDAARERLQEIADDTLPDLTASTDTRPADLNLSTSSTGESALKTGNDVPPEASSDGDLTRTPPVQPTMSKATGDDTSEASSDGDLTRAPPVQPTMSKATGDNASEASSGGESTLPGGAPPVQPTMSKATESPRPDTSRAMQQFKQKEAELRSILTGELSGEWQIAKNTIRHMQGLLPPEQIEIAQSLVADQFLLPLDISPDSEARFDKTVQALKGLAETFKLNAFGASGKDKVLIQNLVSMLAVITESIEEDEG